MAESKKIEFSIENDALIKNLITPQEDENTYLITKDLVITKEVFMECYNRWVKGEENEDMA